MRRGDLFRFLFEGDEEFYIAYSRMVLCRCISLISILEKVQSSIIYQLL